MFEYLSGTVTAVNPGSIVLDVGGVGFEILADAHSCSAVTAGTQTKLYTILRISDDRMLLYGFSRRQQRDLFLKLIAVSGVGPKLAVAVLSGLTPEELITAVVTQDIRALQNVPGVGKKTAQRLLLELQEKVDISEAGALGEAAAVLTENQDAASSAIEALEGLGYSHQEAVRAVAAVRSLGDTAEDLVKFALKRFGPRI